jgi:hypothetical protein
MDNKIVIQYLSVYRQTYISLPWQIVWNKLQNFLSFGRNLSKKRKKWPVQGAKREQNKIMRF